MFKCNYILAVVNNMSIMHIVTWGMRLRNVLSLGILTEFVDIASLCFAKWKELNLNNTRRTASFNRILFIQNVNTTWLPLITHPSKGKDIDQQCSWRCWKKYNCKYLGHQNTWIGGDQSILVQREYYFPPSPNEQRHDHSDPERDVLRCI